MPIIALESFWAAKSGLHIVFCGWLVLQIGFLMYAAVKIKSWRLAPLAPHFLRGQIDEAVAAGKFGRASLELSTRKICLDQTLLLLLGFEERTGGLVPVFRLIARIHPLDTMGVLLAARRAYRTRSGCELEFRYIHPDGQLLYLAFRVGVQVDPLRGRPLRWSGLCVDLASWRSPTENLRDERFGVLVHNAPDPYGVLDDGGAFVDVNAHLCAASGYSREDILGVTIWLVVPAADRSRLEALMVSLEAGQAETFSTTCLRRVGPGFPVEWRVTCLMESGQKYFFIVGRDLTELHHAEQELAVQRGQLARLTRIAQLGELTGALAHELRQPLTAIVSSAQAARRYLQRDASLPVKTAEIAELQEDIIHAGRHAGEVISNLHRMLRNEEAPHTPIELTNVVSFALSLLSGELRSRGVRITHHISQEPLWVRGDKVQLQQVVINLVLNAAESMSALPVEGRLVTVRTNKVSADSVSVEVEDVGSGLAQGAEEKLFTAFYTTKSEGLGLGLAICRSIVELHGGSIAAHNGEKSGAVFVVALALVNEPLAA